MPPLAWHYLDLSPVGYIRMGTLMQQDDDVNNVNLKVVGNSSF
jgi:hypothetical protein